MVGRVVATHGLKGAVRIQILTDYPARFRSCKHLYLTDDYVQYDVAGARISGGVAVVQLEGISTVDEAMALRGQTVFIPSTDATRPSKDVYFWHEIIGLNVQNEQGDNIGEVVEILRTGANDVYVVKGPHGEVLIPVIADVVRIIDPESRLIVIRPLPGLFGDP